MNLQEKTLSELSILYEASASNVELFCLIKQELKKRIAENKSYPREYLFEKCNLQNHSIGIFFIPTTKSYEKYNTSVALINLILNESEFEHLQINRIKKTNTFGLIKANAFINLKEPMKEISFDTNEILDIESR
ncbi:MAG: hypothetical protein P4L28_01640 [Paludibacteraceae bacterium]|nr:hypothetical protein [Paludibacteraceae bacterium]